MGRALTCRRKGWDRCATALPVRLPVPRDSAASGAGAGSQVSAFVPKPSTQGGSSSTWVQRSRLCQWRTQVAHGAESCTLAVFGRMCKACTGASRSPKRRQRRPTPGRDPYLPHGTHAPHVFAGRPHGRRARGVALSRLEPTGSTHVVTRGRWINGLGVLCLARTQLWDPLLVAGGSGGSPLAAATTGTTAGGQCTCNTWLNRCKWRAEVPVLGVPLHSPGLGRGTATGNTKSP